MISFLSTQVIIDEKFFNHSFVYPNFSSEELALQDFIASDLLEVSHKKALEKSGEWRSDLSRGGLGGGAEGCVWNAGVEIADYRRGWGWEQRLALWRVEGGRDLLLCGSRILIPLRQLPVQYGLCDI